MFNSKKPVNVEVKLSKKVRSFDQLLRQFMKLCKEEGIVREVKDRSFFETKSQKRRRKKHASKMRHRKKQGHLKR
jgi:ribosomal protein S21